MQGTIISRIGNNIINLLGKAANKIGEQVDFIKRLDKAKITPDLFARVLILGCLSDTKISLQGFCQLFKQEEILVSKQAIHERFNAAAVKLMKGLFQTSLKELKVEQNIVIELLEPFSSVKLLDSSTISLPNHMKKLYKGCGGVGSKAALKIQTLFDYAKGQIEEIIFTHGRQNDQSFDEHLNAIEERALYIQDLGYFSVESFSQIHTNKAYFVSRLFTPTSIYDADGNQIHLLKKLRKASVFFSMNILLGKHHKVPARLIVQRLSKADAATRARKMRENAKKHGKIPTKETLEFAKWSLCITNTPKKMLKDKQVYLLYAVRWHIELFFKLCKQEAGIDKIRSARSERVLSEIYARLIGVIMLLYMCWPVRWELDGERELSFSKAYNCLRKRISEFFKALNSLYRLKLFLNEFLSDLQDFAMKDIKRKNPATHQKLMASTGQRALGQKSGSHQKLMGGISEAA